MSLVLDCSIALAWTFEEERTDAVVGTIHRMLDEGAVVPSLWHLEVANGLWVAVRRKRISRTFWTDSLLDMRKWNVLVDDETVLRAWSDTTRLAERHGLTTYDAAYLELAGRRRLPLASLDGSLCAAARADGIALC